MSDLRKAIEELAEGYEKSAKAWPNSPALPTYGGLAAQLREALAANPEPEPVNTFDQPSTFVPDDTEVTDDE